MSHWKSGRLKLDLEGKGTGFCWMLSSINIKGKVSYRVKSPGDTMQVSSLREPRRKNQVLKGSSQGKEAGIMTHKPLILPPLPPCTSVSCRGKIPTDSGPVPSHQTTWVNRRGFNRGIFVVQKSAAMLCTGFWDPVLRCISSAETCRVMTNACHASPVARPRWPTAAMSPVSGSATTPPLSSSPLPWWCDLPGPILRSFPQNTVVGSSTSAAVGNILSCDGVPITSGCCDLPGISSCYYGRRRMGGWDSLQWLLFWAPSLRAEEDIPGCSAASDHQPLPCCVSAHKCPEREEALRGQQPHELLRKGVPLAMARALLRWQEESKQTSSSRCKTFWCSRQVPVGNAFVEKG
ncbi:hypothetical protein QYF61_009855 [Mycteria americana]|uniref:Uncharacterized protein n=1 Tax=Mycteria americana TaxID=33587 RepID=A0AAN7N4I9_MYCAM|nr:hypothetical protein QYF61_009855 [Mycteria americana]